MILTCNEHALLISKEGTLLEMFNYYYYFVRVSNCGVTKMVTKVKYLMTDTTHIIQLDEYLTGLAHLK